MKQEGYEVHLIYFWLKSADLAVARVAERVRLGGHNIPEDTIRRRYRRSVRNLLTLYRPVVSTWKVFDTSEGRSDHLIAWGAGEGDEHILDEPVWQEIRKEAGV